MGDQAIQELDHKIAYEVYIREKKDAILEDRKQGIDDDQKSQVSMLRDRYASIGNEADNRSKISKSIVSMRSGAQKDSQSLVGKADLINERVVRDFPLG